VSDTPETDKEWGNWLHKLKMPIESFVDFARKLERERNEWRECAEKLACVIKGQVPWPPAMDETRIAALTEFERLKGEVK
jgi:hypothetical protein